jgi:hypothetical protein
LAAAEAVDDLAIVLAVLNIARNMRLRQGYRAPELAEASRQQVDLPSLVRATPFLRYRQT